MVKDGKNSIVCTQILQQTLEMCILGFVQMVSLLSIWGGRSYSNWPVFLVVYNLSPGLVMRDNNIFLSLLIPGPNSPTRSIDIYLQSLVDELNKLWKDGVLAYDKFKKQNFTMRAALMGTISDYPVLSMLSGWSTKGKLGCHVCMEDTKAFQLNEGGKISFFDDHRRMLPPDHEFRFEKDAFKKNTIETDDPPRRLSGQELFDRVSLLQQVTFGTKNKKNIPGFGETHNWKKRSIFWELSYWKDHLVRHHIDVMHLEMNFFKNILFTLFDVKGKTKDNAKARLDMAQLCSRPHLELTTNDKDNYVKPHATYCLDKKQRREVCEWVKNLKFLDGYASNLSNIVDVDDGSFSGMKSHDCHVFMERLLPTAFRDFLPNPIWEALTEVSNFFRDICAKELDPVHIEKLEKDIIVTMCKLEKIFPPGFFDSMEHLIVHIAYKARVCGPVSFRWMYTFERCIGCLKRKVANKARVEGSILEAYIAEEMTNFMSLYFEDEVVTRLNRPERYDDGGFVENDTRLPVMSYPGRAMGSIPVRDLTEEELKAAHYYIMTNCLTEFDPFIEQFDAEFREKRPTISASGLDRIRSKEFGMWMRKSALSGKIADSRIVEIACGPVTRRVQRYNMYDVNGFRFHTESYGKNRKTTNYGVCVEGENWEGTSRDYFGILEEIIWLEYSGVNNKVTSILCFPVKQCKCITCLTHHQNERDKTGGLPLRQKEKRKPLILFDGDASVENNPHLTEFFQEDSPPTDFVVRAAYELNDPSFFVDGAVPEIVEEQELQGNNKKDNMAPSRKGKGKAPAENEGESSEKNVRGRNAYKAPPSDLSLRPVLRLAGFKTFDAGHSEKTKDVAKIISQEVRNNYPGPYYKYNDFPQDTKDIIEAEFLKHYQFAPDVDEREAWSTFRKIANARLKDMLNKCKGAATKQYGDSMVEWKERGAAPRPYCEWITPAYWPGLVDHWCSNDFTSRSKRNAENRANAKGSGATTGSMNMFVHKQRFEQTQGREPR
ncbi:uncharacterized protein LOC144561865 [Carex rostrata]